MTCYLSELMAKAGALVVIADINETGGQDVATNIQNIGGEAMFMHLARIVHRSGAASYVENHPGQIECHASLATTGMSRTRTVDSGVDGICGRVSKVTA